uniref:Uncharacterized protein n=1 Tax=Anguilla anguilla TaxID=7936 RepID=A0A0E9VI37_ANGAN
MTPFLLKGNCSSRIGVLYTLSQIPPSLCVAGVL